MAEQIAIPKTAAGEHGWRVTFAGMGINLALGILYTWSIISEGIPEEWGWSQGDKSLPYSVCCLVFCLVMVPAGRFQDKFGPRVVAAVGGVLVGLGFVISIPFSISEAIPTSGEMVSCSKNRAYCRNSRFGFWAGLSLCGSTGKISVGELWSPENDAYFRACLLSDNYGLENHNNTIMVRPITNAAGPGS